SLYQPHFLSDCQLPPFDRQAGGIDHLVFVDKHANAGLPVGCIVSVQDFPGSSQLFLRWREYAIDNWNLVGMDSPFAVKAHTGGRASIMLALFRIAEMQGHAIDNVDTRSPRRGHRLGLGIVIQAELLTHRLARPDVSGIVDDSENQ